MGKHLLSQNGIIKEIMLHAFGMLMLVFEGLYSMAVYHLLQEGQEALLFDSFFH